MTPSGIKPMTFQLVEHFLNQLYHCVLQMLLGCMKNTGITINYIWLNNSGRHSNKCYFVMTDKSLQIIVTWLNDRGSIKINAT